MLVYNSCTRPAPVVRVASKQWIRLNLSNVWIAQPRTLNDSKIDYVTPISEAVIFQLIWRAFINTEIQGTISLVIIYKSILMRMIVNTMYLRGAV